MQIERGNVACSNGAKRSNVARLAEARDADPQDRGAQDWAASTVFADRGALA
jgi:hypothetical protein